MLSCLVPCFGRYVPQRLERYVHTGALLQAHQRCWQQRETEKVASAGKKRGSYAKILEELKAKVAKYATENGVSASLKHFKSAQELDLKESTVRGWVTTYHSKRVLSATCLPVAKQCFSLHCCPYLLIYVLSTHAVCRTEQCRHFL